MGITLEVLTNRIIELKGAIKELEGMRQYLQAQAGAAKKAEAETPQEKQESQEPKTDIK